MVQCIVSKIRIFERKCLRKCTDNPYKFDKNLNINKHISNNQLYAKTGVARIDEFLIELATRFIKNARDHDSHVIKDCFRAGSDYLVGTAYSRYQSPVNLQFLLENNLMKKDDTLDYYKRSYVPYEQRHRLIESNNTNNENLYKTIYK